MIRAAASFRNSNGWRKDLSASLVVFLVALPLCLGIAMASGAPLFSGLIAGIVGGIVVGALSKSSLSVSGPAAGLTVIVLNAITTLPSYEAFLLAVCLAGMLQIGLGVMRAGALGDYVPSYVINGLLSAIGIVLILKQIPHAIGYHGNYEGDFAFPQRDGKTTFSAILEFPMEFFSPIALVIAAASLVFLFWWDKKQPQLQNLLRYVPGPLIVVAFGILANLLVTRIAPQFALQGERLVNVPAMDTLDEVIRQLSFPDISYLGSEAIWITAITLALVASIESILSVEAVDKLDPKRRRTPPNRELLAQGTGNILSGAIGGLPVTSVIVRSSANVAAGADSKISTIAHGFLLAVCVLAIPHVLNLIPLAALAAVLISIGYKLAKPEIFIAKYRKGMRYFVPFMATVVAIVFSDPMIGIGIGLACGIAFMLVETLRDSILLTHENNHYIFAFNKDLFFIHKPRLKKALASVPEQALVTFDFSHIHYMDKDNIELVQEFMNNAKLHDISVSIKSGRPYGLSKHFILPDVKTP